MSRSGARWWQNERQTNRLTPHPGPLPVEGRGRRAVHFRASCCTPLKRGDNERRSHPAQSLESNFHKSPIANVSAIAFAAVAAIGAARPDVEAVRMMNARISVLIGISPRIGAKPFDVGAAPFLVFTRGRVD